MTQEEKAKELANYYASETDYIESAAYSSAMAMAEWKDRQLQHYLEVCIEKAEKCENKGIKILLESMKEELGL